MAKFLRGTSVDRDNQALSVEAMIVYTQVCFLKGHYCRCSCSNPILEVRPSPSRSLEMPVAVTFKFNWKLLPEFD